LLLVTAATNISVRFCYSILEILAGDVCFVNLFRSDLPVVPTESDVLLNVGNITTKSGSLKNSMQKMWENTLAPVVSTLRGERPRRPRRSDASGFRYLKCRRFSRIDRLVTDRQTDR